MPEAHAVYNAGGMATSGERVAVVCHRHPSIGMGGAETAAYALYMGLREVGVDAIFVGACEYSDRHRLALGSEHEFAIFYDRDRYDHFYHLAAPALEKQLLAIVLEQQVGFVNFHHFFLIGLNTLRRIRSLPGVRCYYTIHEYLAICHNHGQMVTREAQLLCGQASNDACVSCFPEHLRTQFTVRRETMLEVLGEFDGFIAPSHFLAERFVNWGLPPDRVTVIENGLLNVPGDTASKRAERTWTFGYFGQINPYKGVDVLLDTAELIAADTELSAKIRVRIHGNLVGQSQTFVQRFQQSLKDMRFLEYAGAYGNASVYNLMSDCDYIVVPSKWWENSPVVIQEAFAVRVPVICTGIGGLAEKVRDRVSGLHFARGDPADLLRVIKISADEKVANSLRAGVPAISTAADMAGGYIKFFGLDRKLVKQRPRVVDGGR
jgi:glycosyltransferase involved in cell wall biosynthesis